MKAKNSSSVLASQISNHTLNNDRPADALWPDGSEAPGGAPGFEVNFLRLRPNPVITISWSALNGVSSSHHTPALDRPRPGIRFTGSPHIRRALSRYRHVMYCCAAADRPTWRYWPLPSSRHPQKAYCQMDSWCVSRFLPHFSRCAL